MGVKKVDSMPFKLVFFLLVFAVILHHQQKSFSLTADIIFFFSSGANGEVTYGGILEEGFSINPFTGVITTTKSLDRELQEHYTMTGIVLYHTK